jgi:hypothetical protein
MASGDWQVSVRFCLRNEGAPMCAESQILIHDPYGPPKDCAMEFRLTYEGLLPSSGNNPHANEKHDIRKKFHLQLKKLWSEHAGLQSLKHPPEFPVISPQSGMGVRFFSGLSTSRIDYLAKQFGRANHHWVPLVTKDLSLWCGLDILYLRPGIPGQVLRAGDIDGRMKTLFDALKMPWQLQDLGDYQNRPVPPDENPFFCLLEDDSLVSQASIETDRLLEFVGGDIPHQDDARIVITVRLHPLIFKWENMGFV